MSVGRCFEIRLTYFWHTCEEAINDSEQTDTRVCHACI